MGRRQACRKNKMLRVAVGLSPRFRTITFYCRSNCTENLLGSQIDYSLATGYCCGHRITCDCRGDGGAADAVCLYGSGAGQFWGDYSYSTTLTQPMRNSFSSGLPLTD